MRDCSGELVPTRERSKIALEAGRTPASRGVDRGTRSWRMSVDGTSGWDAAEFTATELRVASHHDNGGFGRAGGIDDLASDNDMV